MQCKKLICASEVQLKCNYTMPLYLPSEAVLRDIVKLLRSCTFNIIRYMQIPIKLLCQICLINKN